MGDNSGFRAFAQKNNFPPLVEERKILQKTFQMNPRLKMGNYNALRPQDYRNTNYFNNMANNMQNNKDKQLECMVCNGRSYDECYRNGIARRCLLLGSKIPRNIYCWCYVWLQTKSRLYQ